MSLEETADLCSDRETPTTALILDWVRHDPEGLAAAVAMIRAGRVTVRGCLQSCLDSYLCNRNWALAGLHPHLWECFILILFLRPLLSYRKGLTSLQGEGYTDDTHACKYIQSTGPH